MASALPSSDVFAGLPLGYYRAIAADVPWEFVTRSPRGQGRSPSRHYKTMSIAEIAALPVASLADRDCLLAFWTTGVHLEQAFKIIRAWGFRYSGMGFVWLKTLKRHRHSWITKEVLHSGTGYTTRKNCEFVLFARRGHPKRLRKDVREPIIEARREHSRKPEQFYRRMEMLYSGPRLDLFSRQKREGWDAWGNQVDRFTAPALLGVKPAHSTSHTPSPTSLSSDAPVPTAPSTIAAAQD